MAALLEGWAHLGTSAALPKALSALSEPFLGCVLPAPALGVCLEQQGRAGGKALPPPVQSAGHCLPQETALPLGYIRGKADTSGEKHDPKVFRSSFVRKLRLLALA